MILRPTDRLAVRFGSHSPSTQQEAFTQRVLRIDPKLVLSRDVRLAGDLGDDRWPTFEIDLLGDSHLEGRSDQAFDHDRLAQRELAARVMDRGATGYAGSGRRAIDFAFREDAAIA